MSAKVVISIMGRVAWANLENDAGAPISAVMRPAISLRRSA